MQQMKIPFLLLFLFLANTIHAQINSLKHEIDEFLRTKHADVGVAVLDFESGDTLTAGNDKRYPMQSVYKFHLALAVLHHVDQGRLSLDREIAVTESDLIPDTWSPLREKYPDGNVELPLKDILAYTV